MQIYFNTSVFKEIFKNSKSLQKKLKEERGGRGGEGKPIKVILLTQLDNGRISDLVFSKSQESSTYTYIHNYPISYSHVGSRPCKLLNPVWSFTP